MSRETKVWNKPNSKLNSQQLIHMSSVDFKKQMKTDITMAIGQRIMSHLPSLFFIAWVKPQPQTMVRIQKQSPTLGIHLQPITTKIHHST